MHRIDGPGATEQNLFVEGNPFAGTPATTVTADWLNAVQEELVELLEALGGSPDKQENDQIAKALMAALGQLATPAHEIGEVFALWDHLAGVAPPDNSGAEKYIRLTAGQSGSGGYNEGLLTDESVTGSGPEITATAAIAVGPLDGESVHLVNTMRAFVRPGESGTLQAGEIQSHAHYHNFGVAQPVGAGTSHTAGTGTATTAATGGDETRPRNVGATYYMRIV